MIAANRLPVTRTPAGRWETSPGGLVRALVPVLRSGGTWVGWSGTPDRNDTGFEHRGIDLQPVTISADEVHRYYDGFANGTLWPLYHDAIRTSGFHADEWDAYVTVNDRFSARLASVAPPGAAVWVHDYHLQLVPAMLRERRPDVRIGWFGHIPFPPPELFERLPWRDEIVGGLLGADLLGFQRGLGIRNLVAAARTVGATEVADGVLAVGDRSVRLGRFPVSIDVDEIDALARSRATERRVSDIRSRLGEPEVVLLGVDRLDYTKGIGSRLRAFGALLDDGRLDPGRHVLVQIATPTREGIGTYQDERREIERVVGEVNGRHARLGFPVVHYLSRSLPLAELVPLYRAGDVMLVTPFRDGMNLVAKEYVASHTETDGALVLSEFTGAADELRDALLVNPHDERALRDTIVEAVAMHPQERRRRMQAMRATVSSSGVAAWARSFLDALDACP